MDILPKLQLEEEELVDEIIENDNLEIVTPDYKKPNKHEEEIFILPAKTEDKTLEVKKKKLSSEKERMKQEKELLKQKRLEEKLEQQALKDADKEFKRIQREKKKEEKLQRQKLRDEEFIRNKSEPIKIPLKEPEALKKPEALKEKKPDDSFEDFLANYQKYEKFKNMILQNEKQNKKTKSVTESERTETTFSETSSDDVKPVFRYDYLNQNSNRRRRF